MDFKNSIQDYIHEIELGKTDKSYLEWKKQKDAEEVGLFILFLFATTFFLFWWFRLLAKIFQVIFKVFQIPLNENISIKKGVSLFLLGACLTVAFIIISNKFNFNSSIVIIGTLTLAMVANWFWYSTILKITNRLLPIFAFWRD